MVEAISVATRLRRHPAFVGLCVAVLMQVTYGPMTGSHLALAADVVIAAAPSFNSRT